MVVDRDKGWRGERATPHLKQRADDASHDSADADVIMDQKLNLRHI